MDHFRKTGDRISAAAKSYNDSVASLQSRFLPACRRFQELTAIADEIKDAEPLTIGINLPQSREKNDIVSEQPKANEERTTASDTVATPTPALQIKRPTQAEIEQTLKEAGSPYPASEYEESE